MSWIKKSWLNNFFLKKHWEVITELILEKCGAINVCFESAPARGSGFARVTNHLRNISTRTQKVKTWQLESRTQVLQITRQFHAENFVSIPFVFSTF